MIASNRTKSVYRPRRPARRPHAVRVRQRVTAADLRYEEWRVAITQWTQAIVVTIILLGAFSALAWTVIRSRL